MAVDNFKEKFGALVSKETSKWHEDARYRTANQNWLRHSQAIAIRINKALGEKQLSQKELAEKMGVSPQQVNKIVKGRENLTLETIAKLEQALGIPLLSVARHTVQAQYLPGSHSSAVKSYANSGYNIKKNLSELSETYIQASEGAKIFKLCA